MSVYVDKGGYRFRNMIMCHMVADTPTELVAMANKIGVALHWFQGGASAPHFDIAQSKRALAIAAGAIDADRITFVGVVREIRKTWPRDDYGKWLL